MGWGTETVRDMSYAKMFEDLPEDIDLMIEDFNLQFSQSKSLDSVLLGNTMLRMKDLFNPKRLEKMNLVSLASGTYLGIDDAQVLTAVQAIDATATTIDSYTHSGECDDSRAKAYMYDNYGMHTGTSCNGQLQWHDTQNITYGTYDCYAEDPNTGDPTFSIQITQCSGNLVRTDHYSRRAEVLVVTYDTSKTMYIFADDVYEEVPNGDRFMAIDYKLNGETEVEKHIHVINKMLGLTNADMDETLSEENLRDFFLGYAAPYGVNEDYDSKIDELMASGGYKVEWNGNFIQYGYFSFDEENPTPYMNFNGAIQVDSVDRPIQYMLPLDWLFKRTARQHYDDLKALTTFFAYSEEEIELKWYQSGIFRILGFIVAIGFAIYGNPTMLNMMIISSVVSNLADGILKDILMIAIAIYSFDVSGFSSFSFESFSQVIEISQQFQSLIYKHDIQNIVNKIEEAQEDTKSIYKTIAETQRKMIYIPLDIEDVSYSMLYDAPYQIYETGYDYERFFEQPTIV